ncbi:hypothetical protein KBC04_00915 [Candidatus Babeliales bacterium]|nr:hypothetical protein [Candidatus Babeliales bacterium]MBP9843704.1 hypothetical protein [Candidatus Babeliales bacterium]
MNFLCQLLFLSVVIMNGILLQASSDDFTLNSLAAKKVYSDQEKDAAIKIKRFFQRINLREKPTSTVHDPVKLGSATKSPLELFFGAKGTQLDAAIKVAECNQPLGIKSTIILDASFFEQSPCPSPKELAARDERANRHLLKMLNNAKFDEENVQTILATFSYLTAEELHMQLKRSKPAMRSFDENSLQIDESENEAVRRKAVQEEAEGVDVRPLVDRMVAYGNLSEAQVTKIERYKNLSLKEIESKLASEVDADLRAEDRGAYLTICKEIYKAKKRDEIIKTYKDYTVQEMADELNELHEIIPRSEKLPDVYQDVILLKMKAEMAEYAAQHGGIFDLDAFVESKRSMAVSNSEKSDKSSDRK